ncbi:hypothetical protein GCM10009733_020550 [Nonomuraea maheshkhaliensis]|uniref:Uncharacterized protein n=1 Tax=Nonomuraea maheshkhaliensis TaxID=419590 RepID=A0ABP4QVW7_9ACTN
MTTGLYSGRTERGGASGDRVDIDPGEGLALGVTSGSRVPQMCSEKSTQICGLSCENACGHADTACH